MALLRVSSLVAFTLVASQAYADPAADKARALELSRAGDQAYKAGEFEKAADLVRQAYALYQEPILLYNLALALDGMGATRDALAYYEQYLATNPDVKDRGAIERRVATMRDQLAAQAAKEREQRESAARVREAAPEPEPASKLPFVTIGVGVATVAVGFGFGGLSASRRDEADTAPSQIASQALYDKAQTYATTANILFIAGGALAVGGAIWALIDNRGRDAGDPPAHAQLHLGPAYVGVAWTMP